MNITVVIAVFSLLLLAGCAYNSGIAPVAPGEYEVSRQAATGFSGMGDLPEEAYREANCFCLKQGKVVQVVNTTQTHPPYIFANFPRVDVRFTCVKPKPN